VKSWFLKTSDGGRKSLRRNNSHNSLSRQARLQPTTFNKTQVSKTDTFPLLTARKNVTTSSYQDKCSYLPTRPEYGVDWLNLAVSVYPGGFDLSNPHWTDKTGRRLNAFQNYLEIRAWFAFKKWFVDVELNIAKGRAYIRFNPSHALYGKSRRLTPASEVQSLISELLTELRPLFHAEFDSLQCGIFTRAVNWADRVSVNRIDCSANFALCDPDSAMKAISNVNHQRSPMQHTYRKKGQILGEELTTKFEGKDLFYDKNTELALHKDSEIDLSRRWYRFETQLKGGRIKTNRLQTLSSINDESVWNAVEARWNATKWGVAIMKAGTIKEATRHLDINTRIALYGYLQVCSEGHQSEVAPSRHRKYQALAKNLGLQVGLAPAKQGIPSHKLELAKGILISIQKPHVDPVRQAIQSRRRKPRCDSQAIPE
jgi:hypothetical protein